MKLAKSVAVFLLFILLASALPIALASSADDAVFVPRLMPPLRSARLQILPGAKQFVPYDQTVENPLSLAEVEWLLLRSELSVAGDCTFEHGILTLDHKDGTQTVLELSLDDCTKYRVDGQVFSYVPAERCGREEESENDILVLLNHFPDVQHLAAQP